LFAAAGVNGGVVDHVVEAFDGVPFFGLAGDVVEKEADLGDVTVAEEKPTQRRPIFVSILVLNVVD